MPWGAAFESPLDAMNGTLPEFMQVQAHCYCMHTRILRPEDTKLLEICQSLTPVRNIPSYLLHWCAVAKRARAGGGIRIVAPSRPSINNPWICTSRARVFVAGKTGGSTYHVQLKGPQGCERFVADF